MSPIAISLRIPRQARPGWEPCCPLCSLFVIHAAVSFCASWLLADAKSCFSPLSLCLLLYAFIYKTTYTHFIAMNWRNGRGTMIQQLAVWHCICLIHIFKYKKLECTVPAIILSMLSEHCFYLASQGISITIWTCPTQKSLKTIRSLKIMLTQFSLYYIYYYKGEVRR